MDLEQGEQVVIHQKHRQGFSKWPAIILAVVTACIIGWYGLAYGHWDSGVIRAVTFVVPFPAAIVNGSWVTYHSLLERTDVMAWLDKQGNSREKLLSQAFGVLVDEKLSEQLANTYNVKVTNDDIKAARGQLMGTLTDDQFQQKIKTELNMSTGQFTDIVLRPLAIDQKLETAIESSADAQKASRSKIDEAKGELAAGKSFSTVAKEFSDDPSAPTGGNLGTITPATLPQGWDALLSMPEGTVSDVIETPKAFVILKVVSLSGVGDNAAVQTQAIIVKKQTLQDVLDSYRSTSSIVDVVHTQ